MMKHMQDGGDLNMLINDAGDLLLICSECKKVWTIKSTLVESPASVKKFEYMFKTAMSINPSLMKDMGIDAKLITNLKSQ